MYGCVCVCVFVCGRMCVTGGVERGRGRGLEGCVLVYLGQYLFVFSFLLVLFLFFLICFGFFCFFLD